MDTFEENYGITELRKYGSTEVRKYGITEVRNYQRHLSLVTCHSSLVTRHSSLVTCHSILLLQYPQMMLCVTGNDPHERTHRDRVVVCDTRKQLLDA
jgi:hypothetical protein